MGSNPTPATHWDVVQVVACLIWDQVVAGSSPVIPIINMDYYIRKGEPISMFTIFLREVHIVPEQAPVIRHSQSLLIVRSCRNVHSPENNGE